MTRVFERARRQAVRDRERAGQPRHRGRRRAQGRLAQPDGAGDQGRRRARLRRLPLLLRGPDHEDAGEQAHRRRLPGHQHLADQPGRDRHRRLGPPPDEGPERDHRHRRDRLPARVGPRLARAAAPARRLEDDDADLDLRPPGDPGRRVRRLPAPHRAAARRARTASTRRSPPTSASTPAPLAAAHPASASAPPLGAAAGRRGRHPDPARRGAAAGGPGRHLAAQGLPHPRPPRRPPRPARPRAQGRPGDPAREPQPDAGADGAQSRPRSCASASPARPCSRRCRACARPTAARSPTSSSTSPRTSSAPGCARWSRPAPTASRSPTTRNAACSSA